MKRSRPVVLLVVVVASGLLLLAGGRTWLTGSAEVVAGLRLPVTVVGSAAAPAVIGVGLLGLAGALTLLVVRGWAARLLAAVIGLAGIGALAAVLGLLGDTDAVLNAQVSAGSGNGAGLASSGALPAATSEVSLATHITIWPSVALAAALLLALAGSAGVLLAGSWGGLGDRYRRAGEPVPVRAVMARPDDPRQAWDALDRGEDPTLGSVSDSAS